MLKKPHHTTNKSTSLFEIRLKNLEHDVLVLKGNEHEAGSVLISGNIVISVNEPITIKKLSLRLYSTLKLKADLTSASSATVGNNRKLLNFKKQIYEYNWDSNEFNKYFDHMYENSSVGNNGAINPPPQLVKNHSTSSLKGLGGLRSKSGLNLSTLSNNNSSTNLNKAALNHSMGSNHVLVQGNYEIPFSAILPGNIPESIEGLPGCSSIYRLEATIDRGKFHSTMITKKHIRVVRTLTTDAVELSETIAVDNTWPKKVEYSLSCPTRALAIGSGTPISMMLVPLLKGLTLGDIKIQLVEFYSYVGNIPPMHSAERIIASKKVAKPKPNEYEFDKWELETFMKIPASLSKCCQDVDLMQHVKVRHKLKFNIGLVNPDGHVSELRASLPVQLFISPFVTVSSKHDDEVSEDERKGEEDILFTSDSYDDLNYLGNGNNNNNGSTLNSNSSSHTSLTGLVAPPLYERHIYDRLWSDVSPIETPLTSGTSTPRSRQGGLNNYGEFSMQPLDSSALSENLRQLSIQRQAQEAEANNHHDNNNGRATFNFEDEDNQQSHTAQPDYFNNRPSAISRNHSFLKDPLMTPMTPPVHLSRVNSDANLYNSNEMKQVPSYSQAIKSDTMDDLSPAYEPPSSNSSINLNELNKNLQPSNQRPNIGSRNSTLSKLSSSRNSSTNSSPSNSRNVSSSNLSNLLPSKKSSSNLLNIGSLTPSSGHGSGSNSNGNSSINLLSTSPVSHLRNPTNHSIQSENNSSTNNSSNHSISQLSSSANDRQNGIPMRTNSSLSLHNLHLFSKKNNKKAG
ncbi:creD [Candida pseudojiufengensis]|uniref:creD n=1 Tax=Candida pseudojiufengensis TaxID=497109 RepID=UPI002225AD4A|nr:creD [Candida pseudojiufengensis]KAI5958971.1 creD [Candida pseudojiufengensis]